MATAKEAAATLRKLIGECQAGREVRRYHITGKEAGAVEVYLPGELRFEVRATRAGVNVKISDDGYVDTVTGGDRGSFSKEQANRVITEVDKLRQLWAGGLPGETTWAPVIISVTPGTVNKITTGGDTMTSHIGDGEDLAEAIDAGLEAAALAEPNTVTTGGEYDSCGHPGHWTQHVRALDYDPNYDPNGYIRVVVETAGEDYGGEPYDRHVIARGDDAVELIHAIRDLAYHGAQPGPRDCEGCGQAHAPGYKDWFCEDCMTAASEAF